MNPVSIPNETLQKIASSPYSKEDSMAALKLGFAQGMSDCGLCPGETEELIKLGLDWSSVPMALATTSVVGGSVLGAYSGLLRHRMEKAVDGKNDPDITETNDKLRAYREMISDLRRTNQVSGVAA